VQIMYHLLTGVFSYWILIPITIVMVLTGVLRHYASVLLAPAPKKQDARTVREQRSLGHGVALRNNHHVLSQKSFDSRRENLVAGYNSGEFLAAPDKKGQPPANPLTDPGAMDGMMGMMKNNMAMIIPNTLIMSWINAFFSGYVISEYGSSRDACMLANIRSETAISHHYQVQEHAPSRCTNQRYGPPLDVQYLLVLPVHLWSAVRIRLSPRQRQW
jgi:hypothetical protein